MSGGPAAPSGRSGGAAQWQPAQHDTLPSTALCQHDTLPSMAFPGALQQLTLRTSFHADQVTRPQ